MNTGCPRPVVRDTALQLLQLLDKRFFGAVGLLAEGDLGKCFLFYLSGCEMRESLSFTTTVLITRGKRKNTEYLKGILYPSEAFSCYE